jgi:hypothetical protein
MQCLYKEEARLPEQDTGYQYASKALVNFKNTQVRQLRPDQRLYGEGVEFLLTARFQSPLD